MITTPQDYSQQVLATDFLIQNVIGTSIFRIGVFSSTTMITLSGWTTSKKQDASKTILELLRILLIFTTIVKIKVNKIHNNETSQSFTNLCCNDP
jgi:hypothetical protein